MPAVSLCETTKKQLLMIEEFKNFNESVDFYLYRAIIPEMQLNDKKSFKRFKNVIVSATPFVHKCLTYFSNLFENSHLIKQNKNITSIIFNGLNLFILHSPQTPPQLFSELYRYREKYITIYNFYSIKKK
jgi:hypothetical protein